jgi:hypothetical protein
MWPFRRQPETPPARDVGERLDDLEDDVKHINRRFTRLQQQVTRWSREYDEDLEDETDEDEILAEIQKRRQA